MDHTNELTRLNKDEEFEYFQLLQTGSKSIGAFRAWTFEEHKRFHEALTTCDPQDTESIARITAVNNYNNDTDDNSTMSKKNQKILSEPWTSEDQKRLDDALSKFPASRYSSVSRWQVISKEIGIPPKSVALRYNQMLNKQEPEDSEVENVPAAPAKTNKRKSAVAALSKAPAKKAPAKRGKKDTAAATTTTTTTTTSSSDSPGLPLLAIHSVSPPKPAPLPAMAKKEPTIHHLNFSTSKAQQLLDRNTSLIDQIRSDIIYTGTTKVDLLAQYKNNITEALKCPIK
eukprot:gene1396-1612_t